MNPIYNEETICALATPAGGAIGLIRVSGEKAIDITDMVFRSPQGHKLTEAKAQTVHYGELVDGNGDAIDEVLVSIYRAPHSYSGENSVEISCHGSSYILSSVLRRLIDCGCRQAEPGEFTKRAYLNGKMDLSQAEAVADLIASTSKATHQMAMGQLRGNVSRELATLRSQLLEMTSLVELELDFSDQDVTFADRSKLLSLAEKIDSRIQSLASSFSKGKAIKDGIPVAIVGKTNVGKSTLLNALLDDDKAIVSDIDGTTRDVIEDTTTINGVTFRFIDTAGLRHTSDVIEKLGIERTYKKLSEAAIVVWVIDAAPTQTEMEDMLSRTQGKKLIIVNNKIDDGNAKPYVNDVPTGVMTVSISAKNNRNIDRLEQIIYDAADIPELKENSIVITSLRHYNALCQAHDSIERVISGLNLSLSGDLLSEDLRQCINDLGEITGPQITSTEVLHNVFSHFCIGK